MVAKQSFGSLGFFFLIPGGFCILVKKIWQWMLDVVQHDCIQQAPHIRPLCFEKHQLFFFKACLQRSHALQCADTIISYSTPISTATFLHPDGEQREKIEKPFWIYLNGDVSNNHCLFFI